MQSSRRKSKKQNCKANHVTHRLSHSGSFGSLRSLETGARTTLPSENDAAMKLPQGETFKWQQDLGSSLASVQNKFRMSSVLLSLVRRGCSQRLRLAKAEWPLHLHWSHASQPTCGCLRQVRSSISSFFLRVPTGLGELRALASEGATGRGTQRTVLQLTALEKLGGVGFRLLPTHRSPHPRTLHSSAPAILPGNAKHM